MRRPCAACRSLGGIPGEALTGIVTEIDLLKGLDHANIVKYIGSFKTRSHLCAPSTLSPHPFLD